jgi:hypothetical protein
MSWEPGPNFRVGLDIGGTLRKRRVVGAHLPSRAGPPSTPDPLRSGADRALKIGPIAWAAAVGCTQCGARLCSRDENWKEHALAVRGNAAERLNSGAFGADLPRACAPPR